MPSRTSISTGPSPRTGDGYFLGLPQLNAAHFQVFLDDFAAARPHTLNVLLIDNSRAHTAADIDLPSNVMLLFQPPYAPELNPAEHVWRTLKDALAWQCFPDLAALQAHVVQVVEAWTAEMLQSLTAYPFIMEALNALDSIADSYHDVGGDSVERHGLRLCRSHIHTRSLYWPSHFHEGS